MDNMFSDDEEFDAIRDQLFACSGEDADSTSESIDKPYRQDVFLRGMEPPTNSLDPYENGTFQKRKSVDLKKTRLVDNFSFFGMKQGRIRMEEPATETDYAAERQKLLKKLDELKEEKQDEKTQNSPKIKPLGTRKTNVDTPRPTMRKRQRKIEISSSEDSESEEENEASASLFIRSPRRKRVSPA